jgi:PAS domain S-box-containing protein
VNEPTQHERHLEDFRTLADAIPQIIWSTRADGSLEFFNEAWFTYTGQAAHEPLFGGWTAALHPADLERTVARWQRSVDTLAPYEIDYRLRGLDGTYRWFVTRGRAVVAKDGAALKWYGACTDIDDLKSAENALRINANMFRRLANSLPQIVWMTDASGTNTFLNNRWFDYTGVNPRAPHSLEAVAHPDDYDAVASRWKHSIATGEIFETEYRIRRIDGVYRWFLVRAIPVRAHDERIAEWFGTCTDIEDQKRAEAEIRNAYEREHRIATTLQRAFLTHEMPNVAGLRFDAVYRPAEREAEVGGDWYDAIALEDGRILISIGDVAGHGLDAAVVMGNVRQSIRIVSQFGDLDPVDMLDAVDRNLRRESSDKIVTAFIGIIDPADGAFVFASAGHPPPLLFTNGTIRELAARGLPLGLREGRKSFVERARLPNDGVLLLYTDGLIESTRDIAEGERRLYEALAAADRCNAENPAEYVQQRVLVEGARDDVAVLAVTISARGRWGLAEQVA